MMKKELDLKIYAIDVDPDAVNQIYTLMAQPSFCGQKVRIMPDVHSGAGCVVGFTSTMSDKVIPNVIGVDIGCGMLTAQVGKTDFDLPKLDDFIKSNIPSGNAVRKEVLESDLIHKLLCVRELRDMERLEGSAGTLGGGNHFIEVDVDEDGNRYIVIHSGSRNLGLQVAKLYQKKAVQNCKQAPDAERQEIIQRLIGEGRQCDIPDALIALTAKYAHKTKVPADLCYLDDIGMSSYMHDMRICQEFAKRNRARMMSEILKFLNLRSSDVFDTIHNYIDEKGIIRKGAISAAVGERVLIPMNMRDGCIIGRGKGNPDWNCSAPHGAGRLCSRSDAKKLLSVDDFTASMQGIYTTTANESTLDEAPMAYKPMAQIVSQIEPTVDIERIIKPIYNFKAAE